MSASYSGYFAEDWSLRKLPAQWASSSQRRANSPGEFCSKWTPKTSPKRHSNGASTVVQLNDHKGTLSSDAKGWQADCVKILRGSELEKAIEGGARIASRCLFRHRGEPAAILSDHEFAAITGRPAGGMARGAGPCATLAAQLGAITTPRERALFIRKNEKALMAEAKSQIKTK